MRPGCDFPIQNLPFGVFSERAGDSRVGVAIGDLILDLTALEASWRIETGEGFSARGAQPFMARPQAEWTRLRAEIAACSTPGRRTGTCRWSEQADVADAPAGPDRRFHRFLRLARTRHQCRFHVPRSRERASAQLAAHPHRL
jgi:hypothetical protein